MSGGPEALSERGLTAGVARVGAGNFVAAAAAALTTPILTHVLGVARQGTVTGATAPLLLLTVSATLGLPTAMTYAAAKVPQLVGGLVVRAVGAAIIAGALATFAVFVFADSLSRAHHQTSDLMRLAGLFIAPALVLAVLRGTALGLRRWKLVFLEQVTAAVAMLVSTVTLTAVGALTVTAATIIIAVTPLFGALAYVPLASVVRSSHRAYDRGLARSMRLAGYSTRTWIGAVAGILLARIDQSLMVPLSDARQLGLYSVAVAVSEASLLINGAIANVVLAVDAASQDDDRLARAGRISTLLVTVGNVCVGALAYPLLGVVFGAGFRQAFPTTIVLLAAVALGNPGSVAAAGLAARGRPGLRSLSVTVGFAANVIAVVVLVPSLGAIGAAIAAVIGNLISSNVCLALFARHGGMPASAFYGIRASDLEILASRSMALLRRTPAA